MDRRQFIQQMIAGAAVLAVPITWAYGKVRYRLIGDGVADDTEAFQALLDGKAVMMPDGQVQQTHGMIYIPPGTYKV